MLLDRVAGVDFPRLLESEAVGILHIRSVYDFDGVDTAPGGIAIVRNPANAAYANAPAASCVSRKLVSQPDEDTRDIADTAFGPTVAASACATSWATRRSSRMAR